MLTLKNLRYAVALDVHRNFGDAARALQISQPTLSRAIGNLETHLGIQLFERNQYGAKPTPSGARLLESARQILLETADLERESELLRRIESHLLRVSLGPYPAVLSGHQAARDLAAVSPQIQCRIQITPWQAATHALHQRETDLALVELIPEIRDDPRLITELVSTSRGAICCATGHPILRTSNPSIESLLAYPWAATRLPARLPIAESLMGNSLKAGHLDDRSGEFVTAIELDLVDQIGPIVAGSEALGLVTPSMIEEQLVRGEVEIVPFQADWLRLNYGFAYLRLRSLAPIARTYMDFVRRIEIDIARKELELWRRFGPSAITAPESATTTLSMA